MSKKTLIILFLGLFAGLLTVRIARAQQPTPSDDQVNAIARQLYCPVCENTPLDVCPTTPCAQWRELIRQKLSAGWTATQIKDYFVQQYGARVLGSPPAKGLNWLAYVVPPLIILLAIYILYSAFRSWRKPTGTDVPAPGSGSPEGQPAAQDEYIKQMEEQVRKG